MNILYWIGLILALVLLATIERRLGEDWARPKGMHATTHERLLGVLDDCEEQRDVALISVLRR